MRRIRALVFGRVQGVAFRAHTRDQARSLGLSGWVRNLPDGSVELEAQGQAETVEALLRWARKGPSWAVVEKLQVTELEEGSPPSPFQIRYGP